MSYELGQREMATLFEKSTVVRPAITEVAKMALAGATEADILSAGQKQGVTSYKADLERILADTDTLLPYADELTSSLAKDFPDRRVVFAARDGEMMADLFVMRYPNHSSALLPASMSLWKSRTTGNSELVVPFLSSHELSKQVVESREAVLFDTGFAGNVGKKVWSTMARHYGRRSLTRNRQYYRQCLPLRMVAANYDSRVAKTQQYFGRVTSENWCAKHFPFSHTAIHSIGAARESMNFAVATAMQLQPHYHESYKKLERATDGRVIAVPQEQPRVLPTDRFYHPDNRSNESFVNTVAAACVQLRVARYALGLSSTNIAEICDPLPA